MRLGLNLVFLVPGSTGGIDVYARELITALLEERTELELTTFVSRAARDEPGPRREGGRTVVLPVDAARRHEWVLGEQLLLPGAARRAGVELVHSLASTAPARGPYRRVVTIHDLTYRVVPEAHAGVLSLGMRVLVPLAARTADRVIAVSRSTRDDVVAHLGVPTGRVDVVPNGLGRPPRAAPRPEAEVRAGLGVGGAPLILAVGAKRAHKNLAALLDALALLTLDPAPVLVLAGYSTPHEAELRGRAEALGVADRVRWPGWVEAAELEGLYAAASAFVLPSLYEGFGLPLLEAMRRGVPAACADTSSLPEVAGDAALPFDPRRPAEIADALRRLLTDDALAARLRELGRAQAQRFTWAAAARGTLASYERALA